MALIIKIKDVQIKNPSEPLEINHYPVTARVGRVSSGLMTMDYVANKKTFGFKYAVIRQDELKKITNLIYGFPVLFFWLSINEDGVTNNYFVYPGALSKATCRTDNDGYWYWKDVAFQLIER